MPRIGLALALSLCIAPSWAWTKPSVIVKTEPTTVCKYVNGKVTKTIVMLKITTVRFERGDTKAEIPLNLTAPIRKRLEASLPANQGLELSVILPTPKGKTTQRIGATGVFQFTHEHVTTPPGPTMLIANPKGLATQCTYVWHPAPESSTDAYYREQRSEKAEERKLAELGEAIATLSYRIEALDAWQKTHETGLSSVQLRVTRIVKRLEAMAGLAPIVLKPGTPR